MERSPARISARRRLAAGVSLLSLAAALAIVVWVFLRNPLLLPLALVGLAVAVMAGWMALISRGLRRIITAMIAIVVLAAVVVLLAYRSVGGLILVLALLVLCNVAARYAFGHERAMVAAASGSRPVRRARNGVLLMNPRSGGAKVNRFRLVDEARRRGIEPVVLHEGDDLQALAETAVTHGADVLGMAGGDGSQALVADIARRYGVAFVCVPAGTRNHFALDLGLDRNDVTAALDAFGDAVERRVDIATVAGRVFVNNASLGAYATIVASPDYRDAKLATTAHLLPDLAEAGQFDLHFTGPDGAPRESADLLLVSNNPYVTRQLSGVGTRPRLDSGRLGLLAVRGNRPHDEGPRPGLPDIEEWTAASFRVDSGRPVPVGIDGESVELEPPLEFRCLPGALRVRLPRNAPGATQTPVYGTRATLGALLRVLMNR